MEWIEDGIEEGGGFAERCGDVAMWRRGDVATLILMGIWYMVEGRLSREYVADGRDEMEGGGRKKMLQGLIASGSLMCF